MTTTILGANGKLGSILAFYARKSAVNWRTQARRGLADIIWSGDFDDDRANDIFLRDSTVINLIGATGGSMQHLIDTNEIFVARLLRKARSNGLAHVVLASSAAVYGSGDQQTSLTENDPLTPATPYGASKVAMETIAKANDAGLAITILRIGNVAGADALMAAARRYVADGKPMPLHHFEDDSTPLRSYIGPRDFFRAVHTLSAPHVGPARIVNLAHPQPVTLDAVLRAYKSHVLPDLTWSSSPAPVGTIRRVTLSTERLERDISFERHEHPADAMARQIAVMLTE